MNSIDQLLDRGEVVQVEGKPSVRGCYASAVGAAVVGLILVALGGLQVGVPMYLVWLAIVVAPLAYGGWAKLNSTSIVLTDKRVLARTGVMRRQTSELMLDRVEGIVVDEGDIFGRFLGYGTVYLSGVGTQKVGFGPIDNPFEFRQAAQQYLDEFAKRIQSSAERPGPSPAPTTPPPQPPKGSWHPDPARRHEMRWWDGTRWTEHVSDAGVAGVDPV